MKKYEGYFHSNGTLMVVKIPDKLKSTVDKNSPKVYKYLGWKWASSGKVARQEFAADNGGSQFMDVSKMKKEPKNGS